MTYLLDTNICIYIIKNKPPQVVKKLTQQSPDAIKVSAITVSELEYGVEKSQFPDKNRIALSKFLSCFEITPFDDSAALHYGKLRAYLEKAGRPIGPMDMLIGAHCLALDMTLVTNNEGEFLRIPGLQIENWAT